MHLTRFLPSPSIWLSTLALTATTLAVAAEPVRQTPFASHYSNSDLVDNSYVNSNIIGGSVSVSSGSVSSSGVSSSSAISIQQAAGYSTQQSVSRGRQGNGELGEAHRRLPPFNAIYLLIPATLDYRPAAFSQLTLTTDSNLLEIITTEVDGDTLIISASEGFSSRQPIHISSSSAALVAATLQGSGGLRIYDAEAATLQLTVLGAGSIAATGQVDTLSANIQGSGVIDTFALTAEGCQLSLQGSGALQSLCRSRLAANLLGSGSIRVDGSPLEKQLSRLGSGAIQVR